MCKNQTTVQGLLRHILSIKNVAKTTWKRQFLRGGWSEGCTWCLYLSTNTTFRLFCWRQLWELLLNLGHKGAFILLRSCGQRGKTCVTLGTLYANKLRNLRKNSLIDPPSAHVLPFLFECVRLVSFGWAWAGTPLMRDDCVTCSGQPRGLLPVLRLAKRCGDFVKQQIGRVGQNISPNYVQAF